MINVLMRTSNRPGLFKRAMQSVQSQTCKDVRIIVGYDDEAALKYIPDGVERHRMVIDKRCSFYWNLYCNQLKELVTDGWFFYLDDDDFLTSDNALERASAFLSDPDRGVIFQFSRLGRIKPRAELMDQKIIAQGKIGGSCIFLHHTKKNVADWDGNKGADWRFIKAVEEKMRFKFVKQVIVETDNSGRFGKN